MPNDPRICDHDNFKVVANVYKLTDGEDGPVTGYTTSLTCYCTQCDLPFEWIGLPFGSSDIQPTVSPDGFQLRAPIIPTGIHMPWSVH